jgi:site-specific DNA recombinase
MSICEGRRGGALMASMQAKGMTEKAKTGGTPGKVPIGYRNVRTFDEGGERRYVEQDPDRAPLIKTAFTLYATGDWTTGTLAGHLETLGLKSVPTAKLPARAISKTQLYAILTNPYY